MTDQLTTYEARLEAARAMPEGPERDQFVDALAHDLAEAQRANQASPELAAAQSAYQTAADELSAFSTKAQKQRQLSPLEYREWDALRDRARDALNNVSAVQQAEQNRQRIAKLRPIAEVQAEFNDVQAQLAELRDPRINPDWHYNTNKHKRSMELSDKLRALGREMEKYR